MKALSKNKFFSIIAICSLIAWVVVPLVQPQTARAAKVDDGTWSQSGSPGTTTVAFDTTGALDENDEIVLTFPSEADVDATGADVSISCSGSGAQSNVTRTENDTNNTITVTFGSGDSCSGAETVTITMTDALDTYTTSTYGQQSVAINTLNEGASGQDYGVAIITNDNTTDVTATVPLFVTMAVDDTTMDLGTLSTSAVNSDTQQYTVNSNNTTGITMQIDGDANGLDDGSGNDINDVADGTVTAGSEEYGISTSVSGLTAESPFDSGDDPVPNSPADIASTTGAVSAGTLDVTYEASIAGTTVAGNYSETVTMTIATNS